MAVERVLIGARPDRVEGLEQALRDLGAEAVSIVDAGDTPVYEPDPGQSTLWPESLVQALFPAGARRERILLGLLGSGAVRSATEVRFEPLADRNWERAWMDRFEPMRFGRGLWICPSHLEPDPGWPVVVRLDPGLAFGTGTHPTTALCLDWIDAMDLDGRTVVDYGTGSGVLAIACALKGAARIVAVDHDPQALSAVAANARRNRVAGRVKPFRPEALPEAHADLVLANILAQPLIELAPKLTRMVASGGQLVLSGILAEQADPVARAYTGPLIFRGRAERKGWVRMDFGHAGARRSPA